MPRVPKKRLSAAAVRAASLRQVEVDDALKKSALTPTTVVRATKKMLRATKREKGGQLVPDWFSRKAAIEILCKLMRLLDGTDGEPIDTSDFERSLKSQAVVELCAEKGRQGMDNEAIMSWATSADGKDELDKRIQALRAKTDAE